MYFNVVLKLINIVFNRDEGGGGLVEGFGRLGVYRVYLFFFWVIFCEFMVFFCDFWVCFGLFFFYKKININ